MARISEPALAHAKIHYNTVMTSVEALTSEPRLVCVTTADNRKQYFDEVVITTPLGWLKQHKGSIPHLHPRIKSAIDSLTFGRLEKVGLHPCAQACQSADGGLQVIIEFPTPFWDSASSDGQTDANDNVSFVHWLSPSYAAQSNPQKWRLECVSFNAFDKPYRRNFLLFYTFGDCSSHITSSIHGLQGAGRHKWLQRFFEPYYSRLPGYSAANEPVRFLATEWCNDEFAGNGSYCNFRIGVADAAGDVLAIRHGMPERRIYFAGEHTAPFDGLGTVAGAYTSGENVAKRIIASRHSDTDMLEGDAEVPNY